MSSILIYPVLVLLLGTLVTPIFKGAARKLFSLFFISISFYLTCNYSLDYQYDFGLLNLNLIPVKIDKLSFLLSSVFHIVGLIGVIYNWCGKNKLEDFSANFYLTSAVGLVLAGDMFTMFVFWEALTMGAVLLLLSKNTFSAQKASYRYLLFHIVGGLILLSGIVIHYFNTGSILMDQLTLGSLATWLIFIGVGINSAWPFFHTWVVDAYPESTPAGIVYLSAFTTKTACYVLIRLFTGESYLIWIGCVMMVFPVFFAVIENNLRRVLSYSLINQVGLIVAGIGIGTDLAINGAVAHIVADIFFKGLLFMSVGAVLLRTGKQCATELGGLYKYMPITAFFCIIGALSISAFPLFSGFVSKSMVVSASAQEHMTLVWFVLLFASAGVLEHAGIKVPFFSFFGHDSGLRPKEAPKGMLFAMGISAFVCVLIGVVPGLLIGYLPNAIEYNPYTFEHILAQMQLLVFAGLAFFMMLLAGIYPPEKRRVNLDFDYFYRKTALRLYSYADKTFNSLNSKVNDRVHLGIVPKVVSLIKNYPTSFVSGFIDSPEDFHKAVHRGVLPSAIGVLFVMILFFIFIFNV